MWLWVENSVECYKFHGISFILFLRYHGIIFFCKRVVVYTFHPSCPLWVKVYWQIKNLLKNVGWWVLVSNVEETGVGHGVAIWEFGVCKRWDWFKFLDILGAQARSLLNFKVGFPWFNVSMSSCFKFQVSLSFRFLYLLVIPRALHCGFQAPLLTPSPVSY